MLKALKANCLYLAKASFYIVSSMEFYTKLYR